MYTRICAVFVPLLFLSTPSHGQAEIGPVIIDNWNKGSCGLTDTIRFSFSSARDIGLIRTWINWPQGVERIPYELRSGGRSLMSGELTRNDCDPYQHSWCQGITTWNARLSAGSYEIVTELGRICQNGGSQSNGFIALYEAVKPKVTETPAPATEPSAPAPLPASPVALPVPALPLPQSTAPSSGSAPNAALPPPAFPPPVSADGIAVGDFDQRSGPFTSDEETAGEFTNVFATTKGIVEYRPSGAVIVSGSAPPGDIDVALFGLGADGDVKITIRPCSASGRVTLYDISGRKLGGTGEVGYGYYGLYANKSFTGLKKGAYALAVEFPDGSLCDDGKNGWTVDVAGNVVDPQPFVGPFENKPDYSVREDLNVDDLIRELSAIVN